MHCTLHGSCTGAALLLMVSDSPAGSCSLDILPAGRWGRLGKLR